MSRHAGARVVERCSCGKAHRSEATWTSCSANQAKPPASAPTVEIRPEDVRTVATSKLGAFVLCPWGGVMAVSLPYRGQEIILTSAAVNAVLARCGGLVTEAAKALAADLAWTAVPELVAAAS